MTSRHYFVATVLILFALTTPAIGKVAATQPSATGAWKLTWSDEFDGKTIDRSKWGFDLGTDLVIGDKGTRVPGWGNNELECYTDSPRNAFVSDGMLHIRALREISGGSAFTSARLTTRGRFQQAYGRFDFRARLPVGRGLWPALWLLPANNDYGQWAASGEIDVMENRGQQPATVLGSIHFGSRWPNNVFLSTTYTFPAKGSVADFHDYSIEWSPNKIRWFVDDQLYATQTHWWSCSKIDPLNRGVKPRDTKDLNPFPAPFDKPFYLLMNLSVGGRFLGPPDEKTLFPAEMLVDYVRVYQPAESGTGIEKTMGTKTATPDTPLHSVGSRTRS